MFRLQGSSDTSFMERKLTSISLGRKPRHKIIIGIDYGTTFSGISYVMTDKISIKDINSISMWPGGNLTSAKTPTRIAYGQENRIIKNKWGFQVGPKLKSYSWTKLLLDKNAVVTEHDDPTLLDMQGPGMLKLPPFRDAAGVCEDFLSEVYKYVSDRLCRQITRLTFENTPMECWITLPAIWSEEAKDATLRAAKNAGFGSRPGDEVFTIAEPEAAAIATLRGCTTPGVSNPIKSNDNILICDCGGGTVDITTYKITQVDPFLSFEELCVGIGGKCGSTYIDRNLHILLSKRFGSAFDEISFQEKGPGSTFMKCFEGLKRDFGYDDDQDVQELGPLALEVEDSEYFDEEDQMVLLSYKDMQSLFDPVIDKIIGLVHQQAKEAWKRDVIIDRIVLVGGFGESQYLYKALEDWCKEIGNLTLVCPEKPQAAVVIGAALRGLEGIAPRVKYIRYHYGFIQAEPFQEGIHPEEWAFIDDWSNTKCCGKTMNWLIAKADKVIKNTSRTIECTQSFTPTASGMPFLFDINLYSCALIDAPKYSINPRVDLVGRIESTVAASDLLMCTETKYNSQLKRTVYRFSFQVQVNFGDRSGILTFKTIVGGKEVGSTCISYDG